jgi:bifunctional N-acetylglucosamine-1-phosphate-uridyltransferase/glucosamine-1-phosphate-acetyltransferase GlmU-like protein
VPATYFRKYNGAFRTPCFLKQPQNTSMIIIIPACGRGERFKAAGYAAVKPLISVYGEPMIDRVISALHLRADDDLYVVSNWGEAGSHRTIMLEQETVGATETATGTSRTIQRRRRQM